jgi:hypothetical protein
VGPVEVDFDDWVVAVFDPTVEDPWLPPAQDLAHLRRFLDDPVGPLAPFTDEEIGIGLWSLFDSGGAGTAMAIGDTTLPLEERRACVAGIRALYDELFVPRCAERLGHLGEQAGRLEMACYMLWDVAAFGGPPGSRDGNLLEDAVLDLLPDVLRIEHAACQESAVHGLGHRVGRHPERAPAVLRRWLRDGPVRDERLRPYAEAAIGGCIQ